MTSEIAVLDYGAGNIRSLVNALTAIGASPRIITSAAEVSAAERVIFPGVGAFGSAATVLHSRGLSAALTAHIAAGKPFLGICIGMQCLFDASSEAPDERGLGIVPAPVRRFQDCGLSIPHMGWNELRAVSPSAASADPAGQVLPGIDAGDRVFFVHSFCAPLDEMPPAVAARWAAAVTWYGEWFVAAVRRGAAVATQFHPEKSGAVGLRFLQRWIAGTSTPVVAPPAASALTVAAGGLPASLALPPLTGEEAAAYSSAVVSATSSITRLARRVVACLDVRENDAGDLVVTKGDQYDVRERAGPAVGTPAVVSPSSESSEGGQEAGARGAVRNFGRPVDLAARYYTEGADEICFLNITAFRTHVLSDAPMLDVVRAASERAFVPLCVGGGIRGYDTPDGTRYTALEVAAAYFRAGCDKVSLGSDAVEEALRFYAAGLDTATPLPLHGTLPSTAAKEVAASSSIYEIARVYGAQAVVVSVDPKRVVVGSEEDRQLNAGTPFVVPPVTTAPDANGQAAYYVCTVHGGRTKRPLDVSALVRACVALGAGEVLVNSIDRDGQRGGFDLELAGIVRRASYPVPMVVSSGAGAPEHFSEAFDAFEPPIEAALAAGIFHRREVPIAAVKDHLTSRGIAARVTQSDPAPIAE
eukprot:TRINITY_DN6696_c0_g1_i1.p1 TRINITY_DN6696_c0_g1~~TRINITY_DN6696_c0_g1_i1.p1  ORF type:complete len:644 (+),score=157.88 TRINITY_DN6696_c0_g1_i1:87-2018(+)